MLFSFISGSELPPLAARKPVVGTEGICYNRREVVNFAVLGDDNPNWRPQSYVYQRLDTEVEFRFPMVKLLDYGKRRAELEASDNPFATVVLAHLDTQETRERLGERKDRKFALVRRLLERGWDAKRVRQLFRLIDWLMELPQDLKIEFNDQITRYQEEKKMPFIDAFEEIGMEKGLSQGRLEAIETVLELRFPAATGELMSEIRHVDDLEQLKNILRAAKTAASPDEVRKVWANGADSQGPR